MRNRILEFLESTDKAKTLIEINDYLNLHTSEELENLQKSLDKKK